MSFRIFVWCRFEQRVVKHFLTHLHLSLSQGPDSHYGTKGMRKVTHESSGSGTKTSFTFCYAAGNNNGTSVEDGQIPEVIFYT
uniref:PHR domain-containing protein n=1 Tax=Cyprinus carpio TaxID=7962 RepID=A0A8C2JL27_CYPCA